MSYKAGDAVKILWGSSWWNGRVARVVGERSWEVAYDGYGSSSNEVVGPDRLQPRQETSTKANYQAGDPVQILWGNRWWSGHIVRVVSDRAWEISYEGYSNSSNEVVGAERLQPRDAPRKDPPAPAKEDPMTLLTRAMTFLTNISLPAHAQRAARAGYTDEEHRLGWKLWRAAAGADEPFVSAASVDASATSSGEASAEIQRFLLLWAPRIRVIARRFLSPESIEQSITPLLNATELGDEATAPNRASYLLDTLSLWSRDPLFSRLVSVLASRGLSSARVERIRSLCSVASQGDEVLDLPASSREDAMQSLSLWFEDWSTTLRATTPQAEQDALGLR